MFSRTHFASLLMTCAGAIAVGAPTASTAVAQCNLWGPFSTGIQGENIFEVVEIDGALFVGGRFVDAGGKSANHIALWDGSIWRPLSTGMEGGSWTLVHAIAKYNGDLIAGGTFEFAGGVAVNNIARWNGNGWESMGTGMSGFASRVDDLVEYKGELYAGGEFWKVGSLLVHNIARWDGTSWKGVASAGAVGGLFGTAVHGLIVYNGDLIAAGNYTIVGNVEVGFIARWDGQSWSAMGSGFNAPSSGLAIYNGDLIVSGRFSAAGGQPANRVARWDGMNWHPMGQGLDANFLFHPSIVLYNGELYGATQKNVNGEPVNYIARWNGSDWQIIDTGFDNGIGLLGTYRDQLVAGGGFSANQGEPLSMLARWPSPCNDLCGNATLIGTGVQTFSTVGAETDGPFEPALCNNTSIGIHNDIWYKFLAQCTGIATISLCGATFDTKIALYSICPTESGHVLTCNEDFCGTSSQMSFAVNAGSLYRIRIGSPTGETGTGTMVITCTSAPPCPADINHDNTVNVTDMLAVINAWGVCAAPCPTDLNTDGTVNVADLLAVINAWGPCK